MTPAGTWISWGRLQTFSYTLLVTFEAAWIILAVRSWNMKQTKLFAGKAGRLGIAGLLGPAAAGAGGFPGKVLGPGQSINGGLVMKKNKGKNGVSAIYIELSSTKRIGKYAKWGDDATGGWGEYRFSKSVSLSCKLLFIMR